MKVITILQLLFTFLLFACEPDEGIDIFETERDPQIETESEMEMNTAVITGVSTSGTEGAYTFAVEITSPDEGCDQYANWWEVVSLEGELLYRRVLGHSHVNEQPFTRSGGPVGIPADQEVWVRAHMNNTGYGVKAYRGSVANGFTAANTTDEFANELATQAPLPDRCAF